MAFKIMVKLKYKVNMNIEAHIKVKNIFLNIYPYI